MNILFFLQPGELTRFILADVIRGVEQLGHRALIWELAPMDRLYQRAGHERQAYMSDLSELAAGFIKQNHVRLSVSMWANAIGSFTCSERNGQVSAFFDSIEEPHLSLWLDAPHKAHEGGIRPHFNTPLFRSPWLFHHTNNPATAREMTDVFGFSNVLQTPYGVNPGVFTPYGNVSKEFDIVFCGGGNGGGDSHPTPAMLEEAQRDEPDTFRIRRELLAQLETPLDALAKRLPPSLHRNGREVLRLLSELQLSERDTPLLDRLERVTTLDGKLAPAVAAVRNDPQVYVDVAFALRSIEHFQRALTVTYLARYFNTAYYGALDLRDWNCRATRLGPVKHEDQARVYSRGRIGLSVMRWEDEQGLHLKPFEITASGLPCLCAWRDGVDSLWQDGTEIVTFRTPAEARRQAHELLSDPLRAQSIAERGRERTLRCHTWAARLDELISQIGRATGRWNTITTTAYAPPSAIHSASTRDAGRRTPEICTTRGVGPFVADGTTAAHTRTAAPATATP